jgi:hypothetical protein
MVHNCNNVQQEAKTLLGVDNTFVDARYPSPLFFPLRVASMSNEAFLAWSPIGGGMISPPLPPPLTSNVTEGEETMAQPLIGLDVDVAATTIGVEDCTIVPIVPILLTSTLLPEHPPPPKAIMVKEEAAAPATAPRRRKQRR